MHSGRNDPCPCGSGRKYKKCCGLKKAVPTSSEDALADDIKRSSRTLDERMLRFARLRLGVDWLQDALDAYTDGSRRELFEDEEQFAMPWAMFHWRNPREGASLAEMFFTSEKDRLPDGFRTLIQAHLHAWLGIWEVRQIDKGRGFLAVDQLTHEERFLHEKKGTENLRVRDSLLAWVLDHKGVSIVGGMHPLALGPRDADGIIREIRRLCGVRTRPAPHECLVRPITQARLINTWRNAVEALFDRPLPTLVNTDGDPLSPVTDYFDIMSEMPALLARVARIPGIEESTPRNNRPAFVIVKKGNAQISELSNTVIGIIAFHADRLCLETNSIRRADQLRKLLSTHLAGLVRHRIREETGSMDMLLEDAAEHDEPSDTSSPESVKFMRDLRNQYMMRWLDESIPLLRGLTPRQAIKTRSGKKEVDILLRDIERKEGMLPEDERIDVDILRVELGLD